MSSDASIPVLSMKTLSRARFSEELGRSFRRFGFAIICDHGMPDDLIGETWQQTAALFALPEAVKRRYFIEDGAGQRGYTPFAQEIAKGAKARDLKEFWHVGREPDNGEPLPDTMPPNIWPAELSGFRPCFLRLYREFERVGAILLSAIATDLGLAPDWFAGPVRRGNSILRLLHYPPVSSDAEPDAIRAQAHEDINLITLLLGAEEAGLQLRGREGQWRDVRPPEGALVVNIGDMLQRLTNHVLPSTTHRVVNPPPERCGISRYSMPFFLHLRPDFVIDALPQCINGEYPLRYLPITADDYLKERLREIGLLGAK